MIKSRWLGLVLATAAASVAAGCGGGSGSDAGDGGASDVVRDTSTGDTGGSDAGGTDATADASGEGGAGDGGAGCTLTRALIGTSDFTTSGGFVVGDVAGRTFTEVTPSTSVDQDHVVRSSGCLVFDMQRTLGAVRVIDANNPGTAIRTITLPGVPGGADAGTASANPNDVVVISPTKAYVAQYNSAQVAIVDPTAGTVTGSIDLSAFADADGVPEIAWLVAAGGKVYVGAQQLDRSNFYAAPAHSHVAVIDPTTNALVDVDSATAGVQGIELSFGDPVAATVTDDGMNVLVSGGGYADPTAGGVDVISVATNTVARTVTATALGHTPSGIVQALGTFAWVGVDLADGDGGVSHAIVQFDYTNGTVRQGPIATPTFPVSDLKRAPDGAVWVIGTDYDPNTFAPTGYAAVYSTTGQMISVTPFTPAGHLAMTSLDFAP